MKSESYGPVLRTGLVSFTCLGPRHPAIITFVIGIMGGCPVISHAGVDIVLTEQPSRPDAMMRGVLGPLSPLDTSPNPCAGRAGCTVGGFAVDGKWPNKYKASYYSNDTPPPEWNACFQDSANLTIGDVAACLEPTGLLARSFRDGLPSSYGDEPEACAFAGRLTGGMVEMTPDLSSSGPIGRCAKYYSPIGSCSFESDLAINASGSLAELTSRPYSAVSSLSCTSPVSGTLRFASDGFALPLTGGGVCNLDLGSGPGVAHNVSVGAVPVAVRVSCSFDLPKGAYGRHEGSGVIVFTAD